MKKSIIAKKANLDWAIQILGEKSKYTMTHVNKLQQYSLFTVDGILSTEKAMNLVLEVATHFGATVAKTIVYTDIQPIQLQLESVEEEKKVVKCLDCGKDCTAENKEVAHPYSKDVENVCPTCFHEKKYVKCPICNKYYKEEDMQGGSCSHCPNEQEEAQQKKGSDFIKIHHYEIDKATNTVIFYVHTRYKKRRKKKFTGTLANLDKETMIYNNLDRSFSRLKNFQKKY